MFAVAVSDNEAGEDALEWLMSELVEDGDEIVAIRVIELDEDGELSSSPEAFVTTLMCLERHDPQQQEDFREQAHELLQTVLDKNNEADERRVSVLPSLTRGWIHADVRADIRHCRVCRRQGDRDVDEDDRTISTRL